MQIGISFLNPKSQKLAEIVAFRKVFIIKLYLLVVPLNERPLRTLQKGRVYAVNCHRYGGNGTLSLWYNLFENHGIDIIQYKKQNKEYAYV